MTAAARSTDRPAPGPAAATTTVARMALATPTAALSQSLSVPKGPPTVKYRMSATTAISASAATPRAAPRTDDVNGIRPPVLDPEAAGVPGRDRRYRLVALGRRVFGDMGTSSCCSELFGNGPTRGGWRHGRRS
jgi:hypothetical protein